MEFLGPRVKKVGYLSRGEAVGGRLLGRIMVMLYRAAGYVSVCLVSTKYGDGAYSV